jgi:8-oxo-dGTP pyrophosphatase MutT (NUDIX family)
MAVGLSARFVSAASPKPAATVVLLRPSGGAGGGLEVLLTRRPAGMRFGPGMHVFPGGGLEAGETARGAAVRETEEETGIELDPATLVPLSRWVTPLGLPSRFDARFFVALVPSATEVVRASEEVADWAWLRPVDALEGMARLDIAMWQPTVVTLQQLEAASRAGGLEDVGGTARSVEDQAFDGGGAADGPTTRRFPHRWAGGVEGRPGTTLVIGDRRAVVVDPGDPTGETADAIMATAARAGIELAGVVVTDLSPDRHAGVELLARGLGLPVAGPPGANALVPYELIELEQRAAVPFGDAGLSVERAAEARPEPGLGATGGPRSWADRAGRLRLRVPDG